MKRFPPALFQKKPFSQVNAKKPHETMEMYVIKASGKKEEFSPQKIMETCIRAGASKDFAKEVAGEIEKNVHDGITTRKILDRILELLKKKPGVASRYDLKRAIMSLGPTGFPFERFFSEVIQNYGYETEVDRHIQGNCAEQEVDVSAKKGSKRFMIECKYHNEKGIYTGLKVALYTHARFHDLKNHFDQAWLVCNTKLTSEAIRYSECMGLKVTSWRYPKGQSLKKLIEDKKLYPVTILRSANRFQKSKLIGANLTLVKDLVNYKVKELKRRIGLKPDVLEKIIREARHVCA